MLRQRTQDEKAAFVIVLRGRELGHIGAVGGLLSHQLDSLESNEMFDRLFAILHLDEGFAEGNTWSPELLAAGAIWVLTFSCKTLRSRGAGSILELDPEIVKHMHLR